MKKERILITGAAGSIGSELARQLSKKHFVYGIDNNESGLHDIIQETGIQGRVGDIRDYETVNDVFSDIKPTKVIHAAAYKHVPLMELTIKEAIMTNVMGTYNMVHCARRWETKKFVYISTDKVVNAQSVMGQTKKLGETMVLNQGKGFMAVRFGNVLGSRGSVIPIWEKQLNAGQPITITDPEMTRFMMTIQEACSLVIEASTIGLGGEIFILDMGRPVRILDLAKSIVEGLGKDFQYEVIGRRKGETMYEKLMTEEEERNAVKDGKFFIIKNNL